MDYYIELLIDELDIREKLPSTFPTVMHLTFIETIMNHKNTRIALQECSPEELQDFEQNGLNKLVSAENFFEKLKIVIERGSYRAAKLRMDINVSTRVCENAPSCKFNMILETRDWTKTFNIAPSTTEKLLSKLQDARFIIRSNKNMMSAEN